MKQFLKTPEARHSVRQIFKDVLAKIDFEELEHLELDPVKVEARVLSDYQSRLHAQNEDDTRSSGSTSRGSVNSPKKRSSSDIFSTLGSSPLRSNSSILSPRKLQRRELISVKES